MKRIDVFREITLDKENHTYHLGDFKFSQSGTKWISQFKNYFDQQKVATEYAKKNGFTADYWIKKWKVTAEISTIKGNACHNYIEDFFNNTQRKELDYPEKQHIDEFLDKFSKRGYETIPELIIGDENSSIAGCVDLLAFKDGKFHLIDWKTNRKIDKTAFKGQKMLKEFSFLDDCNYNHYSIQLSLYAYILKKVAGIEVSTRSVVHFKQDGYEVHRMEDLTEIVEKIIKGEK